MNTFPYPAFSVNNVAIVSIIDINYFQYFSVFLQSIIETSTAENNYDIIVVREGEDIYLENYLTEQIKTKSNFSLRFFDPSPSFEGLTLSLHGITTRVVFDRFKIPTFFQNYSKILALDIDMLVNRDLADLFNIEIDEYSLGVAQHLFNPKRSTSDEIVCYMDFYTGSWKDYTGKYLGINPIHYFNTGCVLWNIKKAIEDKVETDLFKLLESGKQMMIPEQDIMNIVFHDKKIFVFDWRWNVIAPYHTNKREDHIALNDLKIFREANKNPYILHYTSTLKPWHLLSLDYPLFLVWWKVAQKTPFYSLFLEKAISINLQSNFQELKKNLEARVLKLEGETMKKKIKRAFEKILPINSFLVKTLRKVYRFIFIHKGKGFFSWFKKRSIQKKINQGLMPYEGKWYPSTKIMSLGNPNARYKIAHLGLHIQGNAGDTLLFPVVRELFLKTLKDVHFTLYPLHPIVTEELVNELNTYDLIVIGGGGLFLKDTNPNNISGWQWSCSMEMMDKIKTPIALFAVGNNRFRGQDDFEPYFYENISHLLRESSFFSLRNHGSIQTIGSKMPEDLREKIQ